MRTELFAGWERFTLILIGVLPDDALHIYATAIVATIFTALFADYLERSDRGPRWFSRSGGR
jgi:hypothetical protein